MSNLSTQQVQSIVAGLVVDRILTERNAEIYLLRTYGKALEPAYTVWKLAQKFSLKVRQINWILREALPAVVNAVREEQSRMPDLHLTYREGHEEGQEPLYFGITLCSGSEAYTVQDSVQRRIVMGARTGGLREGTTREEDERAA